VFATFKGMETAANKRKAKVSTYIIKKEMKKESRKEMVAKAMEKGGQKKRGEKVKGLSRCVLSGQYC
jgi:hypothetical protein